MKDIGPNPHLNRVLAGLIAVVAALPLYLGIWPLTFLPFDQWQWAVIPVGIGLAILGWAAWLWHRPPINSGAITFRDGGFRLQTKQIFRGRKDYDISWTDLREVHKCSGGYGHRTIEFLLTHDAAVRLDVVKPTTRAEASDLLVRRRIMLAPAWLNVSKEEALARLTQSAEASGFALEKAGTRIGLITRTRWTVTPRP